MPTCNLSHRGATSYTELCLTLGSAVLFPSNACIFGVAPLMGPADVTTFSLGVRVLDLLYAQRAFPILYAAVFVMHQAASAMYLGDRICKVYDKLQLAP